MDEAEKTWSVRVYTAERTLIYHDISGVKILEGVLTLSYSKNTGARAGFKEWRSWELVEDQS